MEISSLRRDVTIRLSLRAGTTRLIVFQANNYRVINIATVWVCQQHARSRRCSVDKLEGQEKPDQICPAIAETASNYP